MSRAGTLFSRSRGRINLVFTLLAHGSTRGADNEVEVMRLGKVFWRDERGTTFEGIALSVSIIAVAFVASADMLDYMTKTRHPAMGEFAAAAHQAPPLMASAAAAKGGVDYTPTASLPKLITRSVLDPCSR